MFRDSLLLCVGLFSGTHSIKYAYMYLCFFFAHFSKTEASPGTAKRTISSKPTESLFSDKEEEQDLFSSSQNLGNAPFSIKPAAATMEGEEEKQKPKKKRPAGAVPMFGGGGDMFGEIGRSKKSSEGGKSEPQVSSR